MHFLATFHDGHQFYVEIRNFNNILCVSDMKDV